MAKVSDQNELYGVATLTYESSVRFPEQEYP